MLITMPKYRTAGRIPFPSALRMIGRLVSVTVAPPLEVEANLPNTLPKGLAHTMVKSSLIRFVRRQMEPMVAPQALVVNMEERE